MNPRRLLLLPLLLLLSASPGAQAQDTEILTKKEHIYEKPTMEELSKLFWSLEAVDVSNDEHVDNYLLINECDIYKQFRFDEFEWDKIRESTRRFLKDKYSTFTRRIEFMQPMLLGEYNLETNEFEIADLYKKPVSRRLEVLTQKHLRDVCGHYGEIEGYPKGLIVELTRPFGIEKFKVDRDIAKEYIRAKLEEYNKLPDHMKTEKRFLESRDAYIWMKIRVFGFKDRVRLEEGYYLNTVFAVLEGMEIYSDRDRRDLIYREDFDFYGKPSDFEQKLRNQYQAMMTDQDKYGKGLKDLNEGVGLLHIAQRVLDEAKEKDAQKENEYKADE